MENQNEVKLTWKDVFDSSKRWWGDRSKASEYAYKGGYLYFTWNGWVYKVDEGRVMLEKDLV